MLVWILGFWHSGHNTAEGSRLTKKVAFKWKTQAEEKKSEQNVYSRGIFEQPVVAQLIKIFPDFYGTRKIITVFTTACHWSLPGTR
jgi:hypothetical protein